MYYKKNWKQTIIKINSTIKEAISNLNKSTYQISLVLNKKGKLVGTLSDGDIRRALLKGFVLEDKVNKIINKNFFTTKKKFSKKKIFNIMQKNKIRHLPLIDSNGKIKNLYTFEDLFKLNKIKNNILIMSGGRGQRLMPLTNKVPKPLLPIKEKPVIQRIIELGVENGFYNFTVSVNYLGKKIISFLKDGKQFDTKINYIIEKKPLGTAGSMGLIKNLKEDLIVINGDVFSNINLYKMLEYHLKNKSFATMAVKTHNIQNPFGEVVIEKGKIKGFREKPINKSMINAGIYIFNKEITKYIKKNTQLDMSDLFLKIIKNKKKNTSLSYS